MMLILKTSQYTITSETETPLLGYLGDLLYKSDFIICPFASFYYIWSTL